jgi:FkbM family methyltransferase
MPLSSRRMTIRGQVVDIHGDASDHYFATLPETVAEHDAIFAAAEKAGLRPKLIVDVGANIGLFTVAAALAFPEARILAFEPNPAIFACLAENSKAFGARVTVRQCAIGKAKGEAMLFPGGPINHARSSGAHLMNAAHWSAPEAGVSVPLSTLDEELADLAGDAGLIKIDVEGFEQDVLEGAAGAIAAAKPLIAVEFNAWTLMAIRNVNPRAFLDYLGASFPFIYCCNRDGSRSPIRSADERIRFLHDNLVLHGCVDDLLIANADYFAAAPA